MDLKDQNLAARMAGRDATSGSFRRSLHKANLGCCVIGHPHAEGMALPALLGAAFNCGLERLEYARIREEGLKAA